MLLFTENLAGVSPNISEVVPVRLVPFITKLLLIDVELLPKLVKVGACAQPMIGKSNINPVKRMFLSSFKNINSALVSFTNFGLKIKIKQ